MIQEISMRFYSSRRRQNDDRLNLVPMQSAQEHERSIALIDRLNARPFERVNNS